MGFDGAVKNAIINRMIVSKIVNRVHLLLIVNILLKVILLNVVLSNVLEYLEVNKAESLKWYLHVQFSSSQSCSHQQPYAQIEGFFNSD